MLIPPPTAVHQEVALDKPATGEVISDKPGTDFEGMFTHLPPAKRDELIAKMISNPSLAKEVEAKQSPGNRNLLVDPVDGRKNDSPARKLSVRIAAPVAPAAIEEKPSDENTVNNAFEQLIDRIIDSHGYKRQTGNDDTENIYRDMINADFDPFYKNQDGITAFEATGISLVSKMKNEMTYPTMRPILSHLQLEEDLMNLMVKKADGDSGKLDIIDEASQKRQAHLDKGLTSHDQERLAKYEQEHFSQRYLTQKDF